MDAETHAYQSAIKTLNYSNVQRNKGNLDGAIMLLAQCEEQCATIRQHLHAVKAQEKANG